jgi:hypothetical protein
MGRALNSFLLDALRLNGDYPRLAERAWHKQEALAAAGHADARPTGVASAALRIWFFEQRLGRAVPDDMADFSARVGFADASAFDRALNRERLFLSLRPNSP